MWLHWLVTQNHAWWWNGSFHFLASFQDLGGFQSAKNGQYTGNTSETIYHQGVSLSEHTVLSWHKPRITPGFVTVCCSMSMVSKLCAAISPWISSQGSYYSYTHSWTTLHNEVMRNLWLTHIPAPNMQQNYLFFRLPLCWLPHYCSHFNSDEAPPMFSSVCGCTGWHKTMHFFSWFSTPG